MRLLTSLPRYPDQHRGMSLIELMIALVLGLLLIAGIIQLFTGTRTTYMANESLARVQENGRFALEMLRQPARQAVSRGFCGGEIRVRSHLNTSGGGIADHIFEPRMSISGWEFTGTATAPGDQFSVDPAHLEPDESAGNWGATDASNPSAASLGLPVEITGEVLPRTDVLLIRNMLPLVGVTGNPAGGSGPGTEAIDLDTSVRPTALEMIGGEILLVTDCDRGDLFQNSVAGNSVTQLGRGTISGPGPGNVPVASQDWRTMHNETLQVFQPITHLYYIGLNVAGEPALFRFDMSRGSNAGNAAEELVQGVENMQLLFGYSLPGSQGGDGQSVDHWLTADRVPDWRLVTAVHIALLVRSPSGAGGPGQAQTFNLAGANVTVNADPQRMRQLVQTTAGLRNRYLVNE